MLSWLDFSPHQKRTKQKSEKQQQGNIETQPQKDYCFDPDCVRKTGEPVLFYSSCWELHNRHCDILEMQASNLDFP